MNIDVFSTHEDDQCLLWRQCLHCSQRFSLLMDENYMITKVIWQFVLCFNVEKKSNELKNNNKMTKKTNFDAFAIANNVNNGSIINDLKFY